MKTRIISGTVGAVLAILCISLGKAFLLVATLFISLLAVYEAYRAFHFLSHRTLSAIGFCFPVAYILDQYFGGEHTSMILFLYVLILFVAMVFWHDRISFREVCGRFAVTTIFSMFLCTILSVRNMENGFQLVWLIFLGAWLTDTFAYFAGSFFGKHKLIPSVSPKKTVEGSIGGTLGTMLSFLIYGVVISCFGFHPAYGHLLILGLLCGLISQVGDLSASVMKREYGIKDFGNLIPGHGGVLDRFDSVLLVAPLVYYYLTMFTILR